MRRQLQWYPPLPASSGAIRHARQASDQRQELAQARVREQESFCHCWRILREETKILDDICVSVRVLLVLPFYVHDFAPR